VALSALLGRYSSEGTVCIGLEISLSQKVRLVPAHAVYFKSDAAKSGCQISKASPWVVWTAL
jgi:hypothetical protein